MRDKTYVIPNGIIVLCAVIIIALLVPFTIDKVYGIRFFSIPDISVITAIILGVITISIAIYIAFIQHDQLNKLKNIGMQTGETVAKLKIVGMQTGETVAKLNTDTIILGRVNDFFGLERGNERKKYKCIFPVEYRRKPLPLINQGDFYAIHVLSTRLGDDNLDLKRITKNIPAEKVDASLLEGNVIFICSPEANPALRKLFDIKEIKTETDMDSLKNWPLEGLGLPCWFVVDSRDGSRIRKIKISSKSDIGGSRSDDLVKSDAEKCYNDASKLQEGTEYEPGTDLIRDYGIFARITDDNNNQHIIMAGLHQYGTWLVASLLSDLLYGREIEYFSTFLGRSDFISIITGYFSNKKLTVNRDSIEVHHKNIWLKEDGNWKRIRDSQETLSS